MAYTGQWLYSRGTGSPAAPGDPALGLHWRMKLIDLINLPRYRAMWADPIRKVRTLESFGATEDDGGRDLLSAAQRATDPELLKHIKRHACEEMLHGELFRRRAAELRAESQALGSVREDLPDKSMSMLHARGDPGTDAHGFYDGSMMDQLGEVAYVATVHVIEKRAAEIFDMHRKLTRDDPKTNALFERVYEDEKYHVSYTGRILDRWRAEGRRREVERAIREAKRSRFLGGWKRLGVRSAAGFGKTVLFVFYWTVLLPFALLGRRARQYPGWQPPQLSRDETVTHVSGQY